MKIGGRELELGRGKRILNKVSVSTITFGVPTEEEIREVALGVREEVREAVAVKEERIVPKEIERVRIIEKPVEREEYMEEGLTSPW